MKTDVGGEAYQYEMFSGLIEPEEDIDDERYKGNMPSGFETGDEPEDYTGPEVW